jgi:hypothetical protein
MKDGAAAAAGRLSQRLGIAMGELQRLPAAAAARHRTRMTAEGYHQ